MKKNRWVQLRNMLAPSRPIILGSDWKAMNKGGWRFEVNVSTLEMGEAKTTLARIQDEYGKDNVTIGQAMSSNLLRPSPSPNKMGIYVRDAHEIISSFKKEIEKYGV